MSAAADCASGDGEAPVYDEPEVVLDSPEHRHLRLGGLEFCFKRRRDTWQLAGCFTHGAGYRVTPALVQHGTRTATEAMAHYAQGIASPTGAKPFRCPECNQFFPVGPEGKAPITWVCGPVHNACSADGWVTAYEPEGRQVFAPGEG